MNRLLVVGILACLTEPVPVQDPAKINWMTDRAKAFAEARRTGKPIWVLFR